MLTLPPQPPSNRRMLRVLVACEYTQCVQQAMLNAGFDAYSCDLLPCEGPNPERHFQQDVRPLLKLPDWDLIIVAHPPCTRLTNSSVQWLHTPFKNANPEHHTPEECAAYALMNHDERLAFIWRKLEEGCALFSDCLNAPCPRIAVENPIMHKYAKERITGYFEATQFVQPWQFGHGETKRTGLWLKGLEPLTPTNIVEGREARVHKMPPGKNRSKLRSKFFSGIAEAMVNQWAIPAEEEINRTA